MEIYPSKLFTRRESNETQIRYIACCRADRTDDGCASSGGTRQRRVGNHLRHKPGTLLRHVRQCRCVAHARTFPEAREWNHGIWPWTTRLSWRALVGGCKRRQHHERRRPLLPVHAAWARTHIPVTPALHLNAQLRDIGPGVVICRCMCGIHGKRWKIPGEIELISRHKPVS